MARRTPPPCRQQDTRDTTFTPNAGRSVKVCWSRSTESLGGDYEYSKFGTASRQYWPLRNGRLIVGLRTDYAYTGEDAPFYSLGFVSLRGVPAFRYLGNQTITVETEARFKLGGRWSIVGFAGAGRAANRFSEIGEAERAYNAGAGFRYLLARKLGLAAGLDAARGPEESAVHLTFGSAWRL